AGALGGQLADGSRAAGAAAGAAARASSGGGARVHPRDAAAQFGGGVKVLALITTARCADLTALCVDSLKQYAPKVTRLILVNQFDRALRRWLAETGEVYFVNDSARGDGSDHAGAIEFVRASGCLDAYGADLIVLV